MLLPTAACTVTMCYAVSDNEAVVIPLCDVV